ncbi:MAG: hypothetical protein HYZ13_11360 [Acidobacteria bacterium]|nr:hypothetical protein [Acidobacteriota bacterium]
MRSPLALLLALPLAAQSSIYGPGVDEGSFKGDPRKLAAAFAERAYLLKPDDARHLASVGRSYLLAGQRKKAEELFAMARARDPKEGDVHRMIMSAWIRAGQRAEALKALEELQFMDPKAHRAFARGAIDLLEGGMDRQAEDLMERAWMLEPKAWEPCVAFARAALRRKRNDLAARWCSRAAIANPQEEKLWKELAQAFAEGGAEAR